MWVLGSSPNVVDAAVKILLAVPSCTWVSRPITASQAACASSLMLTALAAGAAAMPFAVRGPILWKGAGQGPGSHEKVWSPVQPVSA